MFEIKRDINSTRFQTADSVLSSLNTFHSLEVVDRISETKVQVGEISN